MTTARFSVGFVEEPFADAEPGEIARIGLLQLAAAEERFVSHFGTWTEQQYVEHWKRALQLSLSGKPAALITDMRTPAQSSHLVWWPVWRMADQMIFHNQLLFFAHHGLESAKIDDELLFSSIGERAQVNSDGEVISEWTVPAASVEAFLAR